MLDALSLLSRIRYPGKSPDIDKIARRQYSFPLVGMVIGEAVVLFSMALQIALAPILPALVLAFLTVIFAFFVTGIIHIEGLADFADGLMASGTSERKRSAMKDVSLGASGTIFMVADFTFLLILFWNLGGWTHQPMFTLFSWDIPVMLGFVIAEIGAKLAMLTAAFIGPSSHQGMGSVFVGNSSSGKFLLGKAMALVVAFLLVGILFFLILIGAMVGIIIALIARKHFGGVGGDSLGAANEIARLATLLAWMMLI